MDNSGYGSGGYPDADADARALAEMLRLLIRGGKLLLTVPYGRHEEYGWFRTYDEALWQRLLWVVDKCAQVKEWYFQHMLESGWLQVEAERLRKVGYYDQPNAGAAGLAVALINRTD